MVGYFLKKGIKKCGKCTRITFQHTGQIRTLEKEAISQAESKIGTAKVIKSAKGGISEIKPFENNFSDQFDRYIKAERKNELFLNLVDFARKHPEEAAPYAKLTQADDAAKEAFRKGFDGFADDLEKNFFTGGFKRKIQTYSLRKREPVSLDVSEEVFKALDNLLNTKIGSGQQLGRSGQNSEIPHNRE